MSRIRLLLIVSADVKVYKPHPLALRLTLRSTPRLTTRPMRSPLLGSTPYLRYVQPHVQYHIMTIRPLLYSAPHLVQRHAPRLTSRLKIRPPPHSVKCPALRSPPWSHIISSTMSGITPTSHSPPFSARFGARDTQKQVIHPIFPLHKLFKGPSMCSVTKARFLFALQFGERDWSLPFHE